MSSEEQRLALVRRVLACGTGATLLDIGDDAAVLAPSAQPLVVSVDAQIEGVHFRRDWLSLRDIGFRATMAAFSDLAAMGAEPLAALGALVLPAELSDAQLLELTTGQRMACDALGIAIVGGNLAKGGELSLTTTVLGRAERPLSRAGAQPGDALWLCGELGLAAAGLAALQQGRTGPEPALQSCLLAWRRPHAQIEAGLVAASVAHAAIDISDGLALDAARLAAASGCAIELDAAALVAPQLRDAATMLGCEPLALALHGGEDYALLRALPPGAEGGPGARRIGRCISMQPAADSKPAVDSKLAADSKLATELVAANKMAGRLWLRSEGRRVSLLPRGFDHFG